MKVRENEIEYDFNEGKQGAIVNPLPGKQRITIRIDTEILNWFRAKVHETGGGNYQTFINNALREYIQEQEGTLEKTLRKVIRKELRTMLRV